MRFLEPIRVATRSLIPKSIYKRFSSTTNHLTALASLGYANYKQLYKAPQHELAQIVVQNRTFNFRPGTPDTDAIIQNIARHEWLQSPLRHANYILDGGAYIGDTTFAFLLTYPNAKVVCVEPNPDTQALLQRNLESMAKDFILVRGGLASEKKEVLFGGEYIGASIKPRGVDAGDLVTCFDICSIMLEYKIPFFDIVKLDIEGAEAEVLTSNNSWLSKTRRLLVEFHGKEIEQACKAELFRLGFSHFQHRSIHYFDHQERLTVGKPS
jgi:FkbM family methyltransferase